MKLLAFGATGSVGRELVEQALEQGHTQRYGVRPGPGKTGHRSSRAADLSGGCSGSRVSRGGGAGSASRALRAGCWTEGGRPFRRDAKYHQRHGESGYQTAHLSDHPRCRRQSGQSEFLLEAHHVRNAVARGLRRSCDPGGPHQTKPTRLDNRSPGCIHRWGSHRSVPIRLSGKRQDDGAQDLTGRCSRFHVASAERPDLSAPDTGSIVLSWMSRIDCAT